MPVKIFFCYAHEDEMLLNKLKTHLRPLQREGLIDFWYDRDISAGADWEQQIKEQLNTAQIILLLVSPDFMDSDYCYSNEMQRALARHNRGETRVIPIILRYIYWQGVLGKLQALPTDAKPIKSWSDLDEAFHNVTEGISKVVEEITSKSSPPPSPARLVQPSKPEPTPTPFYAQTLNQASVGSAPTYMHSVQSPIYTRTPAPISDQITKRPVGITILTILLFIQAIIEILSGIFTFIGSTLANPIAGLLIGWVPLAIGVVSFIVAWGLWTLKPWAYRVTLILEIVNIVLHFIGYSQAYSSLFAIIIISGGIFSIIIVIYLLVDRNVRRAFRTGI